MRMAKSPYEGYKFYGPYYHKKQNRYRIKLKNLITNRYVIIEFARYRMSVKLGRKLKRYELVDHVNQNPSDDRIENLRILNSSDNICNMTTFFVTM